MLLNEVYYIERLEQTLLAAYLDPDSDLGREVARQRFFDFHHHEATLMLTWPHPLGRGTSSLRIAIRHHPSDEASQTFEVRLAVPSLELDQKRLQIASSEATLEPQIDQICQQIFNAWQQALSASLT